MDVSPIRLIIVDDHAALAWSLTFVLSQEPDLRVVASAATLAEAREHLAGGFALDVALVDLALPDGSGVDLIHEFCTLNPGASAIVLSGTVSDRSRAMAIAAGASGVLDKSTTDPPTIAEAIRAVRRGEPLIAPAEAVALAASAAQFQREEQMTRSALASLTPRELDILQAIAGGLSDKAIAHRLFLSERTVGNHVAGLLRKLGVDSRLQALILATRFGAVKLA